MLYKLYETFLWRQIKNGPAPEHIGLIVDGNRRFARGRGLAQNLGHEEGSKKLEEFLRWCWRLEIKVITLFGFSTENFSRSQDEVDYLMELITEKLKQFQTDPAIKSERVRVKVIGRRTDLSDEMNREIDIVEAMTADHDRFLLNIALSYGGRAEIIDAVKEVANQVKAGDLNINDIDENLKKLVEQKEASTETSKISLGELNLGEKEQYRYKYQGGFEVPYVSLNSIVSE